MNENGPSSLDARELLVRTGKEAFYSKKHEIGGDATMLWGTLDAYLQNLEPVAGFPPDEIVPIEKHSPKYRQTRAELFRIIYRTPGFDIKKVDTIQIDKNGILTVSLKGGESFSLNMIENWNNIVLPKPTTAPIQQKTKESLGSLDKEIQTESFFDGSAVISYIPVVLATGVVAHSTSYFIVRTISVRNELGKMVNIPISEPFKGTKERIRKNILKIIEKTGYLMHPKNGSFYSPYEGAIGETKKSIQTLTYEDYKKANPTSPITKDQFDTAKPKMLQGINTVMNTSGVWKDKMRQLVEIMGKNVGELIFFPIFFHHFGKYQNSFTVLQGITEMGLFTTGAKLGAKVPLPPLLKPLGGLTMGGIFILGGKEAAEKMDATKKKWQYLHTADAGSLYMKGKSTTGHLFANLGIFNMSEYMDLINKGGQKIAEATGVASEDLDIGIPRIEIPTPFGGYKGTIPEITLFQSTVSLGTNPWDWTRSAIGRDSDDWNQKVENYRPVLKRKVQEIVTKYLKNESMFRDEKQIFKYGSKENLLKIHLSDIMGGGMDGSAFEGEKGALIEGITQEAQKMNSPGGSFRVMNEIIDNRVSQMLIDTFFIEKRKELLDFKKGTLGLPSLIPQITNDPKKSAYIGTLLNRMSQSQPLFQEGKWEEKTVLGTRTRKWVASSEGQIYESILADTKMIHVNFPSFTGDITVGNAFAIYLDLLLEYTREHEFIKELQKGNKKGAEWKI